MSASKPFDLQPAAQSLWIRPGFDPFAASAYLFDIDGTLLNTRDGVHWNAFRAALQEVFGIQSLLDDVAVQGNTDIGILRAVTNLHGVSAAEFHRGLPSALALMRGEVERNCQGMQCEVCPSIREFLEYLHQQGKVLGVVSGNLESIGWKKIEAAGLRRYFTVGSFSDQAEERADIFRNGLANLGVNNRNRRTDHQPPTADNCIFVGDTPADIQSARAAGAAIIAVATGIYHLAELSASFPDACVPCCSDLLEWEKRRAAARL